MTDVWFGWSLVREEKIFDPGEKELDIRLTDALALLALLELFVLLASLTTCSIYVSCIREGGKNVIFKPVTPPPHRHI